MINYISGYVLSEDLKKVLLIRKNRPENQAGKLNAIGGKIEDFDLSPLFAMMREFKEETGVETYEYQWQKLDGIKREDSFNLHIFYMVDDKVLNSAKTVTDEVVNIYSLEYLFGESTSIQPILMNTVEWAIKKALFLAQNDLIEVI